MLQFSLHSPVGWWSTVYVKTNTFYTLYFSFKKGQKKHHHAKVSIFLFYLSFTVISHRTVFSFGHMTIDVTRYWCIDPYLTLSFPGADGSWVTFGTHRTNSVFEFWDPRINIYFVLLHREKLYINIQYVCTINHKNVLLLT